MVDGMKHRLSLSCGAFLCLVLACPTPGKAQDQPPKVVGASPLLATLAGGRITLSDFEAEMLRRGGNQPGRYATTETRRALLDEMIRQRALVARARAEGFAKDPAVLAAFERAMVARMQEVDLQSGLESLGVSDDEVAAFYAQHREDYARPARFKAAMIFIAAPENADKKKRRQLEGRAEEALKEARGLDPGTLHFGTLARKYSDDRATRYTGGVIGWLVQHPSRRYKWAPEVVNAIFALSEPGEIGPIVKTKKGFYLVRLLAREEESPRPLKELESGIRHRLLEQKRQEARKSFIEETMTQAGVIIDEAVLESIPSPAVVETGSGGPPPVPAD